MAPHTRFLTLPPYQKYHRAFYMAIVFVLLVDTATILRGKFRDATVVVLSLLLGLTVIETVAVRLDTKPLSREPRAFSVSRPVLGWGPARAGVFRA
jgi:hypothetical protein